jgi:hypothetical protein
MYTFGWQGELPYWLKLKDSVLQATVLLRDYLTEQKKAAA